MQPRRRHLAAALAVVVGFATIAGTSSASSAAARTISVTPTTGISDGQSVAVTLSGFNPNTSVAVAQCASGALQQADCDLGNVHLASTDNTGSASVSIAVHRTISTQNGTVDCSNANACLVGGAELSDIATTGVGQVISFAAVGPPVRGTIIVDPTTFVEGETIAVSGADWAAGAVVRIAQCPGGTTTFSAQCANTALLPTRSDGAFDVGITATASISGLDCTTALGACEVFVADPRDEANTFVSEPILAFAPTVGSVQVSPATNLQSGDTVTVSGTGWTPNRDLSINECFGDCLASSMYLDVVTTDASGAFSTTTLVYNWQYSGLDPGRADVCGTSPTDCSLQVFDEQADLQITQPISFQPSGPVQQGTITAPTHPVVADTFVATASGWAARIPVGVGQCPVGTTDPNECYWEFALTDASGTAALDLFAVEAVGEADCAVAGQCEYVAWDGRDPAGTRVGAPFTVTLPDPGTIVVTPSTGLQDGQTVMVSGSGWRPGYYSTISQCAAGTVCTGFNSTFSFFTDSTGSFSTQFPVDDSASDGNGWAADCTASAGACTIAMYQYTGHALAATAPLTFANSAAVTITSHYTPTELTTIHAAATQLGLADDQYQRVSVWATLWLLGISNSATVPTGTDTGSGAVTSTYPNFEGAYITAYAAISNTTPADLQKGSALLVAYILGLPG